MKKQLVCIFLRTIISILLCGCYIQVAIAQASSNKETKPDIIESKLKDITVSKSNHNTALAALSVIATVSTVQRTTAGGIHFAVTIHNTRDQQITIYNPIEGISVLLTDKDGWPIQLPTVIPRGLLDAADSDDTLQLSFKLVSVSLNKHLFSTKEIKRYAFELPPSGILQIHIEVDKMEETNDKNESPQPQRTVAPLPAGDYHIKILQSLVMPSQKKSYRRILESESMSVALIDKADKRDDE